MIVGEPYGLEADFWALGVLVYLLIIGMAGAWAPGVLVFDRVLPVLVCVPIKGPSVALSPWCAS